MTADVKILIIRLSSIGDILLSTPFIRQTRIAFPNSQIDFVIKSEFIDLVKYNPHINTVFSFDTKFGKAGLKKFAKEIAQIKYDYIFDLHNNFRSNFITARVQSKNIWKISKSRLRRALLVYTKINKYKTATPIPQRYLNVGNGCGISDDQQGLEIFWKDLVDLQIQQILEQHHINDSYIVIAPGAAHFTKRWPAEYFNEFIEKYTNENREKILLLGSESERSITDGLSKSDQVVNLAGKLSILEASAVISGAKGILSNDSGLMHVATSVGTPVLAIFGSTVKELGFFPFRAENTVMENNGLWCRPCSHFGRKRCPLGHFKCMREIGPQHVYDNFKKLIEGGK